VKGRSPRELADKLREQHTASFKHGWAWGSPDIPADGLRGVGVVDFERGLTRVVGVAIPPRVVGQMRAVSIRRPLDRVFFGLLGRGLQHQSGGEDRFGAGSAPGGVPNPIWPVQLLDAELGSPEFSSGPGDREIEARVDLTGALDVLPADLAHKLGKKGADNRVRSTPWRISLDEAGVPTRIAISPSDSGFVDGTFWRVVEFTEFGIDCDGVDLWAEASALNIC
jgi:hypothetical protein